LATYPGGLVAFSTHVNTTEIIDASHPNNIQGEVLAIETAVGITPSLATAATAAGWANTATDYGTVTGRLANIEKGIVADSHTQYLRKASDGANTITPAAAANVGLGVTATSGQTANLTEWRNSSGTLVSYINASGQFVGSGVTFANATLNSPTLLSPQEPTTYSATAATGTINFDVLTQAILKYTTNASANFVLNVRGNGSTTFNSTLATGSALTFVFMNTNGSTPYYMTSLSIDGVSQTLKWSGGVAPTSGSATATDVYTITIIKTASATYDLYASFTKFA